MSARDTKKYFIDINHTFSILIIILLVKPTGIMGEKVRVKV